MVILLRRAGISLKCHKALKNFWEILIIKPTRCTNFSNLFFEWKSTYFRQFLCPSSGVFHCTHSSGICDTGLLTARAVSKPVSHIPLLCVQWKNSSWWTEELSETCRVLFQKWIWEISASSWFYYKNLSRCTVSWTSKSGRIILRSIFWNRDTARHGLDWSGTG